MNIRENKRIKEIIWKTIAYIVITAFGVLLIIPFFWAVSTSLKPAGQEFTYPPKWIPEPFMWENYRIALTLLPFGTFLKNTLIITVFATIGSVLTASLSGYAFARLQFPGKNILFMLCISTMMLPYVVTLVPTFILFKLLGWVDTFYPLIVPSWFGGGAFFIFLCRQFFMTLPLEYDDAAKIDGANEWLIYSRIIMPLSRPVVITILIFNFVDRWNDFMGPLVFLHSMEKRTIAIGLRTFLTSMTERSDWNYLMAASVATIIPILILFFIAQKYFIKGVVMSGLAGR
jgi:ABC-type glycerol-3-phosphate transport system permease component